MLASLVCFNVMTQWPYNVTETVSRPWWFHRHLVTRFTFTISTTSTLLYCIANTAAAVRERARSGRCYILNPYAYLLLRDVSTIRKKGWLNKLSDNNVIKLSGQIIPLLRGVDASLREKLQSGLNDICIDCILTVRIYFFCPCAFVTCNYSKHVSGWIVIWGGMGVAAWFYAKKVLINLMRVQTSTNVTRCLCIRAWITFCEYKFL